MNNLVISNGIKPSLRAKTANAYPIAAFIALSILANQQARILSAMKNHSAGP